jgi:predicted transcriptional regulator
MRVLTIKSISDFQKIAKALSIDVRVRIFELLKERSLNINEIAESLNLPLSTVTVNIQKMEEVDLISSTMVPGIHGSQKICALKYDTIVFSVADQSVDNLIPSVKEISMPIGQFTQFEVKKPCGIASAEKIIGKRDDIRAFYSPDRSHAQLIWFGQGYLEYHFPNEIPENKTCISLNFSGEVCSEAPGYNNKYPSDITLEINDKEIGTWTSPGDFGGKPGKLTPTWWTVSSTQYGLLANWSVTENGSFFNNQYISDVKIKDLLIDRFPFIKIRIGIKTDAKHVGGINIFGSKFGNYAQDLVLRIEYRDSN